MTRLTLPNLIAGLALLGASASLIGLGIGWLATDGSAPRQGANQEPAPIPEAPALAAPPPVGTDAFLRPLFSRDRAPGPDKAPPIPARDPADVSAASPVDPQEEPADSGTFVVKGIIIGENGARAALQGPGGGPLAWVRAGETVNGWKIDSITSSRVRIRNGDEVVEINVREDK